MNIIIKKLTICKCITIFLCCTFLLSCQSNKILLKNASKDKEQSSISKEENVMEDPFQEQGSSAKTKISDNKETQLNSTGERLHFSEPDKQKQEAKKIENDSNKNKEDDPAPLLKSEQNTVDSNAKVIDSSQETTTNAKVINSEQAIKTDKAINILVLGPFVGVNDFIGNNIADSLNLFSQIYENKNISIDFIDNIDTYTSRQKIISKIQASYYDLAISVGKPIDALKASLAKHKTPLAIIKLQNDRHFINDIKKNITRFVQQIMQNSKKQNSPYQVYILSDLNFESFSQGLREVYYQTIFNLEELSLFLLKGITWKNDKSLRYYLIIPEGGVKIQRIYNILNANGIVEYNDIYIVSCNRDDVQNIKNANLDITIQLMISGFSPTTVVNKQLNILFNQSFDSNANNFLNDFNQRFNITYGYQNGYYGSNAAKLLYNTISRK